MPNINFECPECKEGLSVDSKGAGRIVACPKCSKKIQIPAEHANKDKNKAGNDEMFASLDRLSTEELISIWVANDRKERFDESFDVIKNILIARNVPVTTPGQPATYKQKTYVPSIIESKAQMRILTKVNTCSHPKVNGIRSVATLCFD